MNYAGIDKHYNIVLNSYAIFLLLLFCCNLLLFLYYLSDIPPIVIPCYLLFKRYSSYCYSLLFIVKAIFLLRDIPLQIDFLLIIFLLEYFYQLCSH